jgi:hypothetical protein
MEEAWRQRRSAGDEGRNNKIHLTPTGLLMEGVYTSVHFWFAFSRGDE